METIMREEKGARHFSPLVKQDLPKLDADGDTRRLAVRSMKLPAEQLDASTLPSFISQIAESGESGATRCNAISMYEEVALVHGKLVVPHIPKIMDALVRSAPVSGNFPQLQVVCARVASALTRHCIDSTTSQDEADEIMREICTPLIDALAGKSEPVAATAAACIHALAETETWKHAHEEMIHDVCLRTTVAFSEKATRTAAHLELIRILASVNPDVLCLHGATILRAGKEILKETDKPWQLRKAAAQLLQSVLTILDKETLEAELQSALHALDSCRLDGTPHVRAAVSKALHAAKMLASGNTGRRISFAVAPIRKWHADRSTCLHEDHVPASPASKRLSSPVASRSPARRSSRAASPMSQESRRLSFSSASTSALESVQAMPGIPFRNLKKGGFTAKRAPLYSARSSMSFLRLPRTRGPSPSSSTTSVEECQSPSRRLNVKEFNVQSRSTVANGHVYPGEGATAHVDNSLRPWAPLKEVQDSDFPLSAKSAKTRETSGLTQFASGGENARPNSSVGQVEVILKRLKLGGAAVSEHHEHSNGEGTPILTDLPSDSEPGNASSDEIGSAASDVEVEKRRIFTPEPSIRAAANEFQPSSLKRFHKPLALLDVNLEFEEKTSTKEFPPLLKPKRLGRSLSSLSIAMFERDLKLARDQPSPATDDADADANSDAAETASESGWSVRDNPIASEEFEEEKRCGCACESSPGLFSDCSPREIRMIFPSKSHRSPPEFASRGASSPDREDKHPCSSFVSADQTFRLMASGKDMDASTGLPSLLHEDEINPVESTNLTKYSQACDQEATDADSLGTWSEPGLVTRVTQYWRKRSWYAETTLGGTLCLVIALPVAMIIAKTLNESFGESYLLVPT